MLLVCWFIAVGMAFLTIRGRRGQMDRPSRPNCKTLVSYPLCQSGSKYIRDNLPARSDPQSTV
jgi:hypothetical protein